MSKTIRILLVVIAFLAGAFILLLLRFQSRTGVPPSVGEAYVYIPTGASFDQVVDTLRTKGIVRDELIFRQLSEYMKYKREPMRSGRYLIRGGMNIIQLIRKLRGGEQVAVRVVLTNERLPEDVAGKVAEKLEADSASFMQLFTDRLYLDSLGYSPETLMSIFIPNTYEFYWDTPPQGFLQRMIREHDRFWEQNGRLEKAKALRMDPAEVYTLASIVEKETLANKEKPRMAGVYLNRIRQGIPLQADPTAVFARRDFETARVTDYHTKFDSPYNTYMYRGLPPGPIAMSSIESIDAVLNAEKHDYLYFCAIGDGSGLHAFAKTLAQHNQNAQRYRDNFRKRGLR